MKNDEAAVVYCGVTNYTMGSWLISEGEKSASQYGTNLDVLFELELDQLVNGYDASTKVSASILQPIDSNGKVWLNRKND